MPSQEMLEQMMGFNESWDRLREERARDGYHVLPSVRADPLDKLGRPR